MFRKLDILLKQLTHVLFHDVRTGTQADPP